MISPNISIIIPTYNVSKYIEKCLLSVLNQDFEGPIEILVIDDCGNDDSISKVETIISQHPRGELARVIHHEANKGLGPSRNTGVENAQGQYIFFLDSDDWISPNCLKLLYNKIIDTNADVVVGSVLRVEEDTERVISRNIYPEVVVAEPACGVYTITHSPDFHIEVWNKLYKSSFLRDNKICFVHRIFEDYYFDFRLRASASKIAFIPDVTLYYNIRQGSILTNLKASKGTDESVRTFCEIIKYLQQMVVNEYSSIDGIYDLYFQRLIWVVENFQRYRYSPEQWNVIKAGVVGACSFVPTIDHLNDQRHRFVYENAVVGDNVDSIIDAILLYQKRQKNKQLINPKTILYGILRKLCSHLEI